VKKRLWVFRLHSENPRYMGESTTIVDNLNDAVKFHSVAEMWTASWGGDRRDVRPIPIEQQQDVARWERVADTDNFAISYGDDGTLLTLESQDVFVHRRILTEPEWVEVDE
jgi:hypothetical protein